MLIAILVTILKRGLNHNKGNANGPTHSRAITNVDVLKYHFWLFSSMFLLLAQKFSTAADFGLIAYQLENF
jgi:hypothetical protein